MVALTRSSLPWVPHTWMSGTNPLQTPRAWFWGTHKWAISDALLADGVSRTVGSVLVFGPPLHKGIEWRSLRQSSWDGYSVCSGLFWGERWWSVGVVGADGVRPGLGCILQVRCGRWLSCNCGEEFFDFSVGQRWWWCSFSLPSIAIWSAISFPLMPVCAGIHWRTTQVVWERVLMFSVSFFCVVSGSPDTRACRADSESVRKTAFWASLPTKWWFLWHSAVLGLQFWSFSTVFHQVLTQRMEVCLDAWCKHRILRFLCHLQLSHQCRCVSRMLLDTAGRSLPEPETTKLLHFGFPTKWCQEWLSWSQHVGFLVASCLGSVFHTGVHQLQGCLPVLSALLLSGGSNFSRSICVCVRVCVCVWVWVCVRGGGSFELLVQGVVWHPLNLFCMDEN